MVSINKKKNSEKRIPRELVAHMNLFGIESNENRVQTKGSLFPSNLTDSIINDKNGNHFHLFR